MNSLYSKFLSPASRSFTIVETLVAIAIIMVVLITPFHTAEEALNAASISRDELIGDSLAQEGIEYVRSVRDSDYLWDQKYPGNVDWLGGLDGVTPAAGSAGSINVNCFTNECAVDPIDSTVYTCSGSCSTYPLDLGSVGPIPPAYTYPGIYNLAGAKSSNIQTRFIRYIKLTVISPTNASPSVATEVEVTSTVTWTTNNQSYSTTVNDYLQNYL